MGQGQKALTIYTPSSAEPHITAEDDAFIFNSIFGGESGILGSLSCVKFDTSTVRLSNGGVIYNGRILWIPTGQTLDLSIVGGVANHIVAEFTAGGGDTADNYVIKATQSAVANNQIELFRVSTTGTISKIAQNLPKAVNVPNISYGTAAPSGGSNGDIYFRIKS